MKSFITALIISVFMIVGCILHTWHLDQLSDKMLNENKNAIACIERTDFDAALEYINTMNIDLSEQRMLLSAIIDHTEVDKIQSDLAEMKEYTKSHNKADALAKASALNVHLEHLPKDYRLKIENIL